MNISDSFKSLVTNYHVINEKILKENIEIEIWNKKKIKLNLNNRFYKYFEDPIDITVIQIKDSDEIYKYLEFLDYDINYIKQGYLIYKDADVFSIEHPCGEDAECASGKIIKIYDYEFDHNIPTDKGSLGYPILLLSKNINFVKIIGIHKNFEPTQKINNGTFIGEIIKVLEQSKLEKNDNLNIKKDNNDITTADNNIKEPLNDKIKEVEKIKLFSKEIISDKKDLNGNITKNVYIETNIEGKKRLNNEYNDLNHNPISSLGINVGLIDDYDIYKWRVCLIGPKDTPYAKGIFYIHLIFPEDYPKKSPEIVFFTPIYHPNVNPCKPAFKGQEPLGYVRFIYNWKSETTQREILTRLYSIFYLGNPESGYVYDRCKEMRNNFGLSMQKARYFTVKYATYSQKQEPYDKDWDFSCNENVLNSISSPTKGDKIIKSFNNDNNNKTLNFRLNDNGRRIINCHFNINAQISEILKMQNLSGFDLLCIYNGEKINIDSSLKNNGIKENGEIVVIYDVLFAI